jgi:hypothetical protein
MLKTRDLGLTVHVAKLEQPGPHQRAYFTRRQRDLAYRARFAVGHVERFAG